jgi:hypothetical protein
MHNHSKHNCIILKDGVNDPGLSLLEGWPWALLDLGPGLELRSRTAALRRYLRLLLPARAYDYRQKDLHEDANAGFIHQFLI